MNLILFYFFTHGVTPLVDASSPTTTLQFGIYRQPDPQVNGKTVREVKAERARLWGIPSDARAYVGDREVDSDYIIQPGDCVEFHRRVVNPDWLRR